MTRPRKRIALLASVLLALVIGGVAILASSHAVTAAPPGTPTTAGCADDFGARLAQNLGISQDTLRAAAKKTALETVDAAEKAGRLTAAQAQQARDRINASNGLPCHAWRGFGGRAGGPDRDRHGGLAFLRAGMVDATAKFFNITPAQLRQDLREQGSLQGVARKYNKDNATDKAALEQTLETALRQQLTARGLDSAKIDNAVTTFKNNFERIYTQPWGKSRPDDDRGRGPAASPTATR